MSREIDFVKARLAARDSDLVFCHNDLLCRNIVLQSSRVVFIDFEYAGLNPRAYDLANHFAEFAGMLPDYDGGRTPGKNFRLDWITTYLRVVRGIENNNSSETDDEEVRVEAQALDDHVRKFLMLPHLFWGIWAMVQAESSNLDFDYREYARLRLADYFRVKRDCFPLEA